MKNVITRTVGYDPFVKGDSFQIRVQPGDGFLLCSDGLSGPLEDALMFEILEESKKDGLSLSETARELVFTANGKSGDDNITALLVQIL
jgi:protein phosphatase